MFRYSYYPPARSQTPQLFPEVGLFGCLDRLSIPIPPRRRFVTSAKIDSVTVHLEDPAWLKWALPLALLFWAALSVYQYETGKHPVLWLLTTALSLLGILLGGLRRMRSNQGLSDAYLRVDAEGIRIKRLLSRPRRIPWEQVQRVWLRGAVVEVDLRGGRRERCVLNPRLHAAARLQELRDLLGRYRDRHEFLLAVDEVAAESGSARPMG